MKTVQAYRFALDLTPVQERAVLSHICQVDRKDPAPARPDAVVGVDLGVSCLAVLSTGERIGPYDPATGTRRSPSLRWRASSAALVRAHGRVANLRRDGIHKLTTGLAATYGTVVVEDLNVAGMLRNRRLARHIGDAGFGEIRRQLTYKTEWNGGRLVVADRWYPSSKTCSGCGAGGCETSTRHRHRGQDRDRPIAR